jgi:dephospho-CoA kinase
MKIVGLTGSIGMGKSTAAAILRRLRVPVYDADAAVHALYSPGGAAVRPIAQAFPGVVRDGAIDRQALSRILAGKPALLKTLEAIVHPLAREEQRRFLQQVALRREAIAVLDIPLLFETGGEQRCDAVIVMTAPAFLQRQRVLARPGMDERKFELLLSRQMPDAEKRRRATFVVPSNAGVRAADAALRRVLARIKGGAVHRKPACRVRSCSLRRGSI